MEWLDIVDEQDRVVGRDTRENIHADGKMHRSAHILLFNTKGEIFLQLRSLHKDTNPGLWDTSAAGHVDSGESYLECAVRELHEELGVQVGTSAMEPVGQLTPSQRNGFEFTQIFRVCSDQPLRLQKEEIDDGQWLTAAALNDRISTSSDEFTDVFLTIWSMTKHRSS